MKPITKMTDFVIEEVELEFNENEPDFRLISTILYERANFLLQNLADRYEVKGVSAHQLNRFVRCDLDGNILEEPKSKWKSNDERWGASIETDEWKQYQQANERVVFDGFEVVEVSHNLRVVINTDLSCQVFASKFNEPFYLCNEFKIVEDLIKYKVILISN